MFPGCNRGDARKAVEEVKPKAAQSREEAAVLAHAKELVGAAEARDLSALKPLCGNESEGIDATRAYLAEEAARSDEKPTRAKAAGILGEYFERKGARRAREVAGLILIVALEIRCSRRSGRIGAKIAEELGRPKLSDLTTQSAMIQAMTIIAPATGP